MDFQEVYVLLLVSSAADMCTGQEETLKEIEHVGKLECELASFVI